MIIVSWYSSSPYSRPTPRGLEGDTDRTTVTETVIGTGTVTVTVTKVACKVGTTDPVWARESALRTETEKRGPLIAMTLNQSRTRHLSEWSRNAGKICVGLGHLSVVVLVSRSISHSFPHLPPSPFPAHRPQATGLWTLLNCTILADMEKTTQPDLEARTSPEKPQSTVTRGWMQNVDTTHADLICLLLCFLTGLCDSSAYNAWSCFLGMQTGMSHDNPGNSLPHTDLCVTR